MLPKFIQIHTLTSYPPSLLNRDDAGFAKTMPFGGTTRTRISSQCLKRHYRTYVGKNSLASIQAPQTIRSRHLLQKYLIEPLAQAGVPHDIAKTATETLYKKLFGKKDTQGSGKSVPGSETGEDAPTVPAPSTELQDYQTEQVLVLGLPELNYLCKVLNETIIAVDSNVKKIGPAIDARLKDKDFKKNLQALFGGNLEVGLSAALFGRMVTGDTLARSDAAVHVAHAMTVHPQMGEVDYFTAVDDITEGVSQGSAHVNSSELTSGVFYGYVVIDVDGLFKNLGGDKRLAGEVINSLVHTIATVSPGAKKGSTAPYAYSHLMLVEVGDSQPRALSNAFACPVRPAAETNVFRASFEAMHHHLNEMDAAYETGELRAHTGLGTDKWFDNQMSLKKLAEWTVGQVVR